jgi:hypothetical protein
MRWKGHIGPIKEKEKEKINTIIRRKINAYKT